MIKARKKYLVTLKWGTLDSKHNTKIRNQKVKAWSSHREQWRERDIKEGGISILHYNRPLSTQSNQEKQKKSAIPRDTLKNTADEPKWNSEDRVNNPQEKVQKRAQNKRQREEKDNRTNDRPM